MDDRYSIIYDYDDGESCCMGITIPAYSWEDAQRLLDSLKLSDYCTNIQLVQPTDY